MKVGDWIGCCEGIGQVLQVSDYFVEEYCQEYLRDKQIGAPLHTLVVYKILCDFDGKLRKRNKVVGCNISLCSEISNDSKLVLEGVKNKYSEDFEKFLLLEPKRPLKHDVRSWLLVSESMPQKIADTVNQFNSEISSDFTFGQTIQFINEKYPGIDLFDTSNMRTANNVGLVLDNSGFKVNEKRALFSGVKAFVK